jgi:hypothetical protein
MAKINLLRLLLLSGSSVQELGCVQDLAHQLLEGLHSVCAGACTFHIGIVLLTNTGCMMPSWVLCILNVRIVTRNLLLVYTSCKREVTCVTAVFAFALVSTNRHPWARANAAPSCRDTSRSESRSTLFATIIFTAPSMLACCLTSSIHVL